tara:strand:- start:351 stop:1280 length:930 start_codon:yes stop_codon:yes gene_type:complete
MNRKAPIRNTKLFEQPSWPPVPPERYPGILPDSDAPRHPPFPKIGDDGERSEIDPDDVKKLWAWWRCVQNQQTAREKARDAFCACCYHQTPDGPPPIPMHDPRCSGFGEILAIDCDALLPDDVSNQGGAVAQQVVASESYNQPCSCCGPQQLDEGWSDLLWELVKKILKNPPGIPIKYSAGQMPSKNTTMNSLGKQESFESFFNKFLLEQEQWPDLPPGSNDWGHGKRIKGRPFLSQRQYDNWTRQIDSKDANKLRKVKHASTLSRLARILRLFRRSNPLWLLLDAFIEMSEGSPNYYNNPGSLMGVES